MLILEPQPKIPRQDPQLNEWIERLDTVLTLAGGDTERAWGSLSPDENMFIVQQMVKCAKGPGVTGLLHWLCNYFFIKTKQGGFQPIFPLWDSQWLILNDIDAHWKVKQSVWFIILKARQLGISTLIEGIVLYLTIFNKNWNSLLVADAPDQTEYLFEMARNGYETLPWWMKPERRYNVKGHHMIFDREDELDRIKRPGIKSALLSESANQRSGAGYGKTIRALHASEVPKFKNLRILTEGIIPTVPKNSPGVFVILEGAAQRRHDDWHRFWNASEEGLTSFEPKFIAWFKESQYFLPPPKGWNPTDETVSLYEQVRDEYTVQLKTGQLYWYEKQRQDYIAAEDDDSTFLSQYPSNPTEAFQNAGLCAFSKRKLHSMLIKYCRDPIWRGEIWLDDKNDSSPHIGKPAPDGRLKIWETAQQARRGNAEYLRKLGISDEEFSRRLIPPDADAVFYVAGDPSMGVPGGDPSCWQVTVIPTSPFEPMRQVATWHGFVGPEQFARIGVALGNMYGQAEVCPEANGIGQAVVGALKNVLNYPRIYRWRREDKVKGYWSDFYGWSTTMTSKALLIGKMREGLDEDLLVIRDAATLDEAYDFVDEGGNSYYSISKDGHGDRMMALMIAFYTGNQLRPMKERSEARNQYMEETRDPNRDFVNTDYAPAFEKVEQATNSDFMCL